MEILTSLGNSLATPLADTALSRARELELALVVAFSDAMGGLVHFRRMETALPVSTTVAMDKAYTAAVLRMPTHEAGRQAQPGHTLYGLRQSPRMIMVGGGLPLEFKGRVIGAVGISGGTPGQDLEVARAVRDDLKKMAELAGIMADRMPPELVAGPLPCSLIRRALKDMDPGLLEGSLALLSAALQPL